MAAQTPTIPFPNPFGFHFTPKEEGALTGAIAGLGLTTSFAPGNLGANVQAGTDVVQTANNAFNLSGWFVRIGEILAGLVLLGIGLNAMLKGRPMAVVTNAAGLAAKAVPK